MILCFIDIKAVSVTNSFDYDDVDDDDDCKQKEGMTKQQLKSFCLAAFQNGLQHPPRPVWNSNLSEMTIGFSELSKKRNHKKTGKRYFFVSSTCLELLCNVALKFE